MSDDYLRVLQECSNLYSEHYGKWSHSDAVVSRRGEPIKLSVNRLKEWLGESTIIYLARNDCNILVGYAIALRIKIGRHKDKIISWVTQLVVHSDYRNKSIAKTLLRKIWQFSNDYAWGIVSANPYAIRALESTTHRKCDPLLIRKNIKQIFSIGCKYIPYINETMKTILTPNEAKIDTCFFVDHFDVPNMLRQVMKHSNWSLGDISDGWEWLAFTFQNQPLTQMSDSEWRRILECSDESVKDAYRRMDISSNKQQWTQFTDNEVHLIIKECRLRGRDTVLDLGCGTGRHAFGLAERGIHVIAVDYLKKHFNDYKQSLKDKSENTLSKVEFICDDSRVLKSLCDRKFKAVICLYDVIGSYVDNADNKKILRQIFDRLEPGGYALISVMNYDAVGRSHNFSPDKLLNLPASNVMEMTGNIFDPKYFLVDTSSQVVYRKELFEFGKGNLPPVELIVRDRRFKKDEIERMCRDTGFNVEFSRYARSGLWDDTPLINPQNSAKEILVKCRKK
jgi:SAM-dependent methyltransferase/GNAT superfamily N-acetyltransferase